jgi:hypothetical protein
MTKNKARSNRALVAVMLIILAVFIGADMLGNLRVGSDYNTPLALTVIVTATVTAIALFAVNVITYRNR